jgi:hypothetical protein
MAPLTNQSATLADGTMTTRAMIRAQISGVEMRNCLSHGAANEAEAGSIPILYDTTGRPRDQLAIVASPENCARPDSSWITRKQEVGLFPVK